MLWTEVLMRQSFTSFGAAQFMKDANAILSLVERYLPNGTSSMSGLIDGLVLLNLPVESAEERVTLKDASDRIFTDNTEAKQVLEELGIDSLTPANARNILQRRVENSE
jgi:RAD50-interacting protein 1